MGTKHSVRHYHGVWACGIYCNRNLEPGQDGTTFELKSANQRWCRCLVCTRVRQAYEREVKKRHEVKRIRPTRPQLRKQRELDMALGKRLKDGWTRCTRCGVLTPNYFGLCRNCNERQGDLVDIDAIVTWNSGPAIHRRGMGTVCRVGGRVI